MLEGYVHLVQLQAAQSHGGGLDGLGEGASDIPGFLSEQSAEPGRAWGGNAYSDKCLEM